jgi:hypothetical protein
VQFLADKVLDIISVKRDNKTKKNVLAEFDKLYTNLIHGRKGCLFSNMNITALNLRESMVTMTLTLLPNQVFILPASYVDKIVDLEIVDNNFILFDNHQLKNLLRTASYINLASNDKELEAEFYEQQEDSFITITDMIDMYFNEPVFGIAWQNNKIRDFTNQPKFDLKKCQKNIMITINVQGNESFPRAVPIENTNADDSDEPEYNYYADFAIFNLASNGFQTTTVPMNFDSVDYNWFAGGQSVINDEYANALESRVQKIYRESWICQYFDYEPKCEDGVVFFYYKARKLKVDSYRFHVNEYIPANSRSYFLPKSEWATASDEEGAIFCRTNLLSNVTHGLKVTPCYSTKSLFYTAPFFLLFRTSPSVNSNYLIFNNFFKPNSETTILAMLLYNETDDMFIPQFLPEITLPYLKSLSLNNVLEFKLYDTNLKQVQIADSSQLFVTLSLIP